jgi:hypothetical protein
MVEKLEQPPGRGAETVPVNVGRHQVGDQHQALLQRVHPPTDARPARLLAPRVALPVTVAVSPGTRAVAEHVQERGPVRPTPLPLPSVGSAAQSRRNANADPVVAWIGARRRSRPDRVGRTRSGLGWPALPACRRGAVRFSQQGVSGGYRNECSQTLAGTPLREKKFVSLVSAPLRNAIGHPQRVRGFRGDRLLEHRNRTGTGGVLLHAPVVAGSPETRPQQASWSPGRCKSPDPRDGRPRSSGSRRPGGRRGPP